MVAGHRARHGRSGGGVRQCPGRGQARTGGRSRRRHSAEREPTVRGSNLALHPVQVHGVLCEVAENPRHAAGTPGRSFYKPFLNSSWMGGRASTRMAQGPAAVKGLTLHPESTLEQLIDLQRRIGETAARDKAMRVAQARARRLRWLTAITVLLWLAALVVVLLYG